MPRLQKIVTLSTMKAEYVVTTEACKELIQLKNFMRELGKEEVTLSLHNDSQIAIVLPTIQSIMTTKYIDVRCHFICILLKDDVLSLAKIHASRNPIDILNKVVMTEKLKTCLAFVGPLG